MCLHAIFVGGCAVFGHFAFATCLSIELVRHLFMPGSRSAWIAHVDSAMPVPDGNLGLQRGKELSGFKDWLRSSVGWLSLIHDAYGPELWETVHADHPIRPCGSPEQVMRSKRLFHILQQQFMGYSKNRKSYQISDFCNRNHRIQWVRTSSADSKGVLFDVQDGSLEFRRDVFEVPWKRTEHLLDIIREVESEIESFHAMLDASAIDHQLGDVRISEGGQFLLYLRNLRPDTTVMNLCAMQFNYITHFLKPTPWSQTLPFSASPTLLMAPANLPTHL